MLWDLHFVNDENSRKKEKRKAESLPLHFRA